MKREIDVYFDTKHFRGEKKSRTIAAIRFLGIAKRDFFFDLGETKSENHAKFLALSRLLGLIRDMEDEVQFSDVNIFTDCWMVIDQYEGKVDTNEKELVDTKKRALAISRQIKSRISLQYVPKSENKAVTLLQGTTKNKNMK